MSRTKDRIDLDGLGVSVFWLAIALLILAFGGDPDLMDAIIHWISGGAL
jgi:hypothetical protein